MNTIAILLSTISGLIIFIVGILLGQRKSTAEIKKIQAESENIITQNIKTTLDMYIRIIEDNTKLIIELRKELVIVKSEMTTLREENAALRLENHALSNQIGELRRENVSLKTELKKLESLIKTKN